MAEVFENKLYIIKMKNQADALNKFREFLESSKNETAYPAYYNLTDATSQHDKDIFNDMKANIDYRCALLDYQENEISCIYWCICNRHKSDNYTSIHCRLKYKTEDRIIIENFVDNLQLDLEEDFPEDSYINFEISESLVRQMKKFEMAPYIQEKIEPHYEELLKIYRTS